MVFIKRHWTFHPISYKNVRQWNYHVMLNDRHVKLKKPNTFAELRSADITTYKPVLNVIFSLIFCIFLWGGRGRVVLSSGLVWEQMLQDLLLLYSSDPRGGSLTKPESTNSAFRKSANSNTVKSVSCYSSNTVESYRGNFSVNTVISCHWWKMFLV